MATATLEPAPTSVQHQLVTAQDLFIRRWGEMGATWGINRTMAEIHAFLYITGQPQSTDDVMERLNISRGNTSMNLRALCEHRHARPLRCPLRAPLKPLDDNLSRGDVCRAMPPARGHSGSVR